MRRSMLVALAAAAVAAALAGSAAAVIGGSPDGGAHPYVGMAVWFPDGNPADGFEACSGSLLSPTVFLTAAHCFPEGAQVIVSVDPNARTTLFATGVPGTAHPDPTWQSGGNGMPRADSNDLAVVQLADSLVVSRYAKLPARVGFDDALPNNQLVDLVGYGLSSTSTGAFGVRLTAQTKVIPGPGPLAPNFLKLSSAKAAVCSGDSGGPDLLAGTDTILAINAGGPNGTCNAVEYSQRLDTAHALAFVGQYLR
jgi:secreted trypsin-like serine protease